MRPLLSIETSLWGFEFLRRSRTLRILKSQIQIILPRGRWSRHASPFDLLILQNLLLLISRNTSLLLHEVNLHILDRAVLINEFNDFSELEPYLVCQFLLVGLEKVFQTLEPLVELHRSLDVLLPLFHLVKVITANEEYLVCLLPVDFDEMLV